MTPPLLTDLTTTPFDPELTPGAYNAVNTCLRIQPEEKVTVITDVACRDIAASIAQELVKVGSPFKAFVLEEIAERPLTGLPREIADDMETSQVSIFAVRVQQNELKSRMEMTDIVNRRRMRHAHMVNINHEIMLEGMRADFNRVDALSKKVMEIVTKAKQVSAKNPAGSDLVADLNPNYKWIKTSGIISPDKWGNLPGGEIFTTPGEVNGTYVVDGVVGDYLCEKYPDLQRQPLTIHIKRQPHHRSLQREQGAGAGILGLHPHRREQRRGGRVRHRHQPRAEARDRQHSAGREISRPAHRLRQSLRTPHRRAVVLQHAHRRGRHPVRHLG